MAVGQDKLPTLLAVPGIRVGTVSAGIKTPGRRDLVLLELAPHSQCAAVFTDNAFCAAPVTIAREHLQANSGHSRYLLVNTGNANAGTGAEGLLAARRCCAAVAGAVHVPVTAVLPFSTGVIGEPLPVALIERAVPELVNSLDQAGWAEAASGILTTDTRPKGVSRRFGCAGREYVITGIAKGAGMIRPNMATMLAFLGTDVAVQPQILQPLLGEVVQRSFNRITVDGDTSTNDACVLVASGAAGNPVLTQADGPLYVALREALEAVCLHLAQALVRDGEGAGKFVTVQVNGGRDEAECLAVAYTIAHSPLVKTALFASDPNWGRILAAIGRAGIPDLDVNKVSLHLNDVLIAEHGCRAAGYSEELGVAAMASDAIEIRVELQRGAISAAVWTTDLSYDYVRINAEYRS